MDIDLTKKLKQKMSFRSKIRGRYNASELYFINNGMTKPEDFIDPKEKPIKDILNMWAGIGLHNQIEDLMGKENSEKKREFFYKDITLVGKADYLPIGKNQVWEFKTSEKLMEKAKAWHIEQVKLYCTMFELPEGVIFQPVQNSDGVYLKNLGVFKRDDEWFQGELEKLYQFHLKVESLWQAKLKN